MKLSHRQDVLDTLWNSKGYFETEFDAEEFTMNSNFNVTFQEMNGIQKFCIIHYLRKQLGLMILML